MRIFVVDSHAIYCRGLVAALEAMPLVSSVASCDDALDAIVHPALSCADAVLVDPTMIGASELIETARTIGVRVIACTSDVQEESARALIDLGCGYLLRDVLQVSLLRMAVEAAYRGGVFLAPGAPGGPRGPAAATQRPAAVALNPRELQVLKLVADGFPTREIAIELCYSERTVKNILHDIVTKLNVRNRVQAAVRAVREGII